MPDDGHVFGPVAFSQTGLVLFEGNIERPVQPVLDAPVAAHGGACAGGVEPGGGYEVSGLIAAAVLKFGARADADDGGGVGQAHLAGKAAIAVGPGDLEGHGDGAPLDAAEALVDVVGEVQRAVGSVSEWASTSARRGGWLALTASR